MTYWYFIKTKKGIEREEIRAATQRTENRTPSSADSQQPNTASTEGHKHESGEAEQQKRTSGSGENQQQKVTPERDALRTPESENEHPEKAPKERGSFSLNSTQRDEKVVALEPLWIQSTLKGNVIIPMFLYGKMGVFSRKRTKGKQIPKKKTLKFPTRRGERPVCKDGVKILDIDSEYC